MILHAHPKRLRLLLQVPSDAAHAQDPQHLALRIVAQRRIDVALPLAGAHGEHGAVEAAQGAQDQEYVVVGGCVVDGRGCVGDADIVRRAGVDVDLVVAGA